MAKAVKKSQLSLVETLEQRMRYAIDTTPELSSVSEMAYCEAVLEALDLIAVGVGMRKHELEEEKDEPHE